MVRRVVSLRRLWEVRLMTKLQKLKLFQKTRRSRELTSRDPWAGTDTSLVKETRDFGRLRGWGKRLGWKGKIKRIGKQKTKKGVKNHLVMMELIQAELSSGFLKGTRTKLESRSCGE